MDARVQNPLGLLYIYMGAACCIYYMSPYRIIPYSHMCIRTAQCFFCSGPRKHIAAEHPKSALNQWTRRRGHERPRYSCAMKRVYDCAFGSTCVKRALLKETTTRKSRFISYTYGRTAQCVEYLLVIHLLSQTFVVQLSNFTWPVVARQNISVPLKRGR